MGEAFFITNLGFKSQFSRKTIETNKLGCRVVVGGFIYDLEGRKEIEYVSILGVAIDNEVESLLVLKGLIIVKKNGVRKVIVIKNFMVIIKASK